MGSLGAVKESHYRCLDTFGAGPAAANALPHAACTPPMSMDPPQKPIRNNLQEQLGLWRQDKKTSLQQGFAPHTISRLADTGDAADKRWVALVLTRLLAPRRVP